MTEDKLINVGFGNLVMSSRIIAIAKPDSTPIKRFREEAKDRHKLIDVTQGRKTRSILITDSDHIILSALQPDTLLTRFKEHLSSKNA